jgi:hypothetical protein
MPPVHFEPITLEPLRTDGADALDTHDIPGIHNITLREIQFVQDNAFHECITRKADDLFLCFAAEYEKDHGIPPSATLVHAFVDIQFEDSPEPRSVLIRLPSTIKFERDPDAQLVFRWLYARGFITVHGSNPETVPP